MTEQDIQGISCKYCGSKAVVKFGSYEGIQRHWCKACNRKFRANDHLFNMKTPYYQVSSALDDYFKGDSISEIRDSLHTHFNNCPSTKTIYGWITKYTNEAVSQYKDYIPQVSDTYIGDETVLKIGGKKYWCIAIIDKDTRFLLGVKLSTNRSGQDIADLLKQIKAMVGKPPKKILTDGWGGYREAIEQVYGSDSKHIVTEPFTSDPDNTELIERWNGTLKERTKSLRGLKSVESANRFLAGFLAWYNYMRPHESLNGMTPAEKAKIKYTAKSWVDIVRTSKPHSEVLTTPAKVDILSERKPLVRPITNRTYNLVRKKQLRITARTKRITPKKPRITQPKPGKCIYANKQGSISRRHFRGSRRIG
jgi:putative transposase